MNPGTWKTDHFMLETHGLRALDDLESELKAIVAESDFPEGRLRDGSGILADLRRREFW